MTSTKSEDVAKSEAYTIASCFSQICRCVHLTLEIYEINY